MRLDKELPYDHTNPESILLYAKKLLNKSLRQILGDEFEFSKNSGKGNFGQMVEKYYFRYQPNSVAEPDFKEAGLELKTAPLKKYKRKDWFSSKEKLPLNMISYSSEANSTFEKSSFWSKNQKLLLLFYLWIEHALPEDYIFKLITILELSDKNLTKDLLIIKNDWQIIISKIKDGRAHEISEGDTFYLCACRKGQGGEGDKQLQYNNNEVKAYRRAYALKSKFLKIIIDGNLNKTESILPDTIEKVDLESFVLKKFSLFIGLSYKEALKKLRISYKSNAKNNHYLLSSAILGIDRSKKIDEFEKADIKIKTIVLNKSGSLKESMSFAQIRYNDIIKEEWTDSFWYNTLTSKYFFVIFQKDEKNIPRLKKVMFWTMPVRDLEIAYKFWKDTKKKILDGDYDNFIKISDDMICHVRPKARDSRDLTKDTPQGIAVKKKCYWLNESYILQQIG